MVFENVAHEVQCVLLVMEFSVAFDTARQSSMNFAFISIETNCECECESLSLRGIPSIILFVEISTLAGTSMVTNSVMASFLLHQNPPLYAY